MPLPLRRIRLPLDDPSGILSSTLPPGVGRFILLPSAASQGVIGNSSVTSEPST